VERPPRSRVTRRLEKNSQIFQKIAQKVDKSKKAKISTTKLNLKAQTSKKTTFEALKVAQSAKNRPIWSPCPGANTLSLLGPFVTYEKNEVL
jgi:hypothetical protein